MRESTSEFVTVRGLRLHLRRWPGQGRLRVILHGWLDTSATWQHVVDHLPEDWPVLAPDQRGFGHSGWAQDTYWFYDYVADLDAMLDAAAPDATIDLIGHSMGSQVAALFAGLRPDRVRRLVLLDGFYLPLSPAKSVVMRGRRWLQGLRDEPATKRYASIDELAERIQRRQPRLDAPTARFVASCWSEPDAGGGIRLLGDPRHRESGPIRYDDAAAKAIFSQVTAPTLILDAGQSYLAQTLGPDIREARLNCFAKRERAVLPDASHMLHFDAPADTARAIQDFLSAE